MDRKFSDPNEYDNSIDWDDEPDGSHGGYTRHGNYIVPAAMMEIVELRAELHELHCDHAHLDARFTKAVELLSMVEINTAGVYIAGGLSDEWKKARKALVGEGDE
jgi:hypothetical protein